MTIQQRINDITHDGIVWLCTNAWRSITDTISQDAATQTIIELLLCITAQVRRDAYIKTITESINKLNAEADDKIKKISKDVNRLEKLLVKANDDDRKNILQQTDDLRAALQILERNLLPVLGPKELAKYVKDALELQKKEKREKQKNIFDDSDANTWDEDVDDPWVKCPKFINVEEVKTRGFAEVSQYDGGKVKRYGYYTYNPAEKTHKEAMNFTITPIFQIIAGRDTRYMVEVNNGHKKAFLDLNKRCMISIEMMALEVVGIGNFMIYAGKLEFLRIMSHMLQNFMECNEIQILGWQANEFYAMTDCLIVPQPDGAPCEVKQLDEYGVSEIEKENYILPGASIVYKKLAKSRFDPFENDRVLAWTLSPITFNQWTQRMQRVYGDKGMVGVAYAVLTVFRDIAFDIDNNFPHLYGYGDMSSGKSKWGESVARFFYNNRPAFNLNSGTDAAFFSYMSKFRNGLATLNEFDSKVIKPEWFQSIKGVYDGESRQRMNMADRSKIETQKVEGALLLLGQFLVTMDDNSVVSRSLIEPFSQVTRTEDDNREYIALKDIEQQGITSLICDVLRHRSFVKMHYKESFNTTLSDWRKAYPVNANFNQRIMQNWCHLYTAINLIDQKMKLDANMAAFKQYCFDKAAHWCNFIRSTDTLSEFWNTVAFLVDQGLVKYGWDYVIKEETSLTVRKGTETEVRELMAPTKVMYMRMNNVHKLYESAFRSRTGNQGMTMDSLMHYSGSRNYYLGAVKSHRFERIVYNEHSQSSNDPFSDRMEIKGEKQVQSINTSCQAFLYDQLNIDIEREIPTPAPSVEQFPFGPPSYQK